MLFERLIKALREERAGLEKMLSQGNVEDFSAYKFLVGKIRGLTNAIEICRDTFKRYDNDESN